MKAYMAWEKWGGPEEGAVLVFANNVVEARKVAFPYVNEWTGCEYLDVRARWLRNSTHVPEKDTPHAVHLEGCRSCERWYDYPVNADGLCRGCAEDIANDPGAHTDG